MSAKHTTEHPAVASAKRALRRAIPHLTDQQVFQTACIVETLAYGEDRGHWGLNASSGANQTEHHWRCDEDSVTKRGTR